MGTTADNVSIGGTLAVTGATTLTGAVTAPAGITGDVIGDITGAITGDVTGNLTGDVTGDVTGNVTGDVTGDLTGNVAGATTIDGATITATTVIELETANGGKLSLKKLTELVTIAAAATTESTIQIPANTFLIGVGVRTTVATTTAVSYDLGITGDTARFLADADTDLTQASTAVGLPDVMFEPYASATGVLFTPNATPGDADGRVRLDIWYVEITAPTS